MADWSAQRIVSSVVGQGPEGRLRALGAGAVGALAVLAALLPATDAGASGGTPMLRVQSAAATPNGARALGAQSGSTTESGMVVLKPRDAAAVQKFVASVNDPRS